MAAKTPAPSGVVSAYQTGIFMMYATLARKYTSRGHKLRFFKELKT